jgi:pilus assembly protein FimV
MAAAAMLVLSTDASALGLGRVNVQSVLGETLRAEIEVTSLNAEEASSLRVSLASPEAFKTSGVEYNPVLAGAQITLGRRANGTPVLVLSSDKVVQEPFVDVIVDFQWSTGRLTRSYTLLIDPPGRNTAAQPGTAPVAPVFTAPAPSPRAAAPAPAPQAAALPPSPAPAPAARTPSPAPSPAPAPVAKAPRPAPAPRPAATEEAAGGDTVKVRPGDTLTSIASAHNKPGVSLDQMLVSLYRSNTTAFIDDNMNRMKSGVTLAVPSAEQAKQLSTEEAHQVIQAQSADFAAYRQRLAGGVTTVHTDEGKRQSTGKIEAQVHDQKTAAAPPVSDKLTLSRGAVKGGAASSPEAKISKETQRQAEAARVAELSRNLTELKKLGAGTPPPPVTTPGAKPAVPAIPVPAPTLARPAAPVPAPAPAPVVAAPKPAPAPSIPAPAPVVKPPVVASAPAPAVVVPAPAPVVAASVAASAPAAVASVPAPAPAAVVPPVASAPVRAPARPVAPPPPPEESFLSSLTDQPYIIPGLIGLVAVLGGFAFWRKRQGSRKFSGETSFIESKIQPDSFFGASGGQRVDTRDGATSSSSSSLNYSLSQLDAIGDVDPVAEADVYLAYGRDLQAEEILKEAQRSDPDRLAIRTKLLEVYAKRADLKTFESQARQLLGLTNGQGEDWMKAQELGRQIDPTNPLYHEGADFNEPTQPTPLTPLHADDADATLIRPPAAAERLHDTQRSDFESTDLPIDFDLDSSPRTTPQALVAEKADPIAAGSVEEIPFEVSDFDLEDAKPEPAPAPRAAAPVAAAVREDNPVSVMPPPSIDFDFGDLSLDLDTPGGAATRAPAVEPALPELDMPAAAVESEPMARKIELADEFRRIGDHEGARELLEEVVSKADGPLKSRAQTMLDALG